MYSPSDSADVGHRTAMAGGVIWDERFLQKLRKLMLNEYIRPDYQIQHNPNKIGRDDSNVSQL